MRTLHNFSGIIFHDGVYWIKHMWGPSSGKLETKNIFFRSCFMQEVSAAQCVSCSKQERITTLPTCGSYWLHPSSCIILIDGVYWIKHMWGPSSGKLETKNIFFRSCFLQVVCAAQSVSCS